jgi:hypothetical protein
MRIDASGNVGIGVVPKTWHSNYPAVQFGAGGSLMAHNSEGDWASLNANMYNGTSSGDFYIVSSSHATSYVQSDGKHTFKVAPVGTANATISWITAMTIANDGDITIGGNGSTPDLIFNEGNSSIIGPLNQDFIIRSRGNGTTEGISLHGADGAGIKIDKAGNVGIGATPSHHLHVASSSTTIARFEGSNAGNLYITNDSHNVMTLQGSTNTAIAFNTGGGNERMRITATGFVGIGTSSPNEKLEVAGSVKVGNLKIQNANGGRIGFNRNTTNGVIYDSNYSAHQINGAYSGANYLDIQSYSSGGTYQGSVVVKAGSVGIGTTTPDASMKLHVNGNIAAGTNDWYYFGGVTNGIGCTSGADMLNFKTGNSIKMSLTGGSLGIGTQYPTDSLHIFKTEGGVGAAHATIKLGGYSNTGIKIQAYRDTGNSNDQGLIIQTHNTSGYTERMRIDSAGNMGIGTIPRSTWSPSASVLALKSKANNIIGFDNGSGNRQIWIRRNARYNSSGQELRIEADYSQTIDMDNAGDTVFYTAPSGAAESFINWKIGLKIVNSGAVKLYHGGNLKLHTAVNGIGITGNIDGSSDGAVGYSLFSDWAGMQLAVTTNHHLGFKTSNAERMRIDKDGYVSVTKSIKVGDDTRTAAAAEAGTLRWNGGKLQSSDGTDWLSLAPVIPFSGTGGTKYTYGGYTIHAFTSSATFVADMDGTVDVMIVAGGGGSSQGRFSSEGSWDGGGGAGGLIYKANENVTAGSYSIVIGSGGGYYSTGGNSSAFGNNALGGGYGGISTSGNGTSGGSGGGGGGDQPTLGGSGTAGQGHAGGPGTDPGGDPYYEQGGGGGGAGEAGNTDGIGYGGDGLDMSSYFGTTYGESGWFAGGGAGGGGTDGTGNINQGGQGGGGNSGTGYQIVGAAGVAGTANTGGGGAGGRYSKTGGSGIVILRYLT